MTGDAEPGDTIKVFFSYSHKDRDLRDELDKHLSALQRQGWITTWNDREIEAGQKWATQIDEHLNTAQVILLLVSSDFLASDYCYDVEAGRAMERYRAGDAQVIAVILRPVDLEGTPFSDFQCLPTDAKPVTSWSNRDEAFLDITKGIRKVIEKLLHKKQVDVKQQLINVGVNTQHTEIFTRMAADRQKTATERWKILQETQREIFEIAQATAANKARTQDKMFEKWDEYIRG